MVTMGGPGGTLVVLVVVVGVTKICSVENCVMVVREGATSTVTVTGGGQLVGVQSVMVSVTVIKVMVASAVTVTVLSGGVLVVITGHPVMLIRFVIHPQGGQMSSEQGIVVGKTVMMDVEVAVPVAVTVMMLHPWMQRRIFV